MWPFTSQSRDRKRIKKLFGEYVNPDALEDILSGQFLDNQMTKKDIDYVLILIDGNDALRTADIISSVVTSSEKYNGMIETITGSLVVVLFGALPAETKAKENRKRLIEELTKTHGAFLSIVHGQEQCFVGTVGSESRKAFTALIPNYKDKLSRLSSLKYGEQHEVI